MLDDVSVGMSGALPSALLKLAKEKARNTYLATPQGRWIYIEDWEKNCPRVYEFYKKNKREKIDLIPYEGSFKNGLVACEAVRIAVQKVGAKKVTGEDVYRALQTFNKFRQDFYSDQSIRKPALSRGVITRQIWGVNYANCYK